MQSNLTCLDTDCGFNKSNECYASHIKVEGFEAAITPETYCDSFVDKTYFSISNSNTKESLTTTQNISCSANNCKYNVSGGCNASHVQINSQNASCESFVAK